MSISIMKKLSVITPKDSVDEMIKRLIKLRCVDVRNTESDECGYLLEKMNYDVQRSNTEKRLAEIERVLPVLTKYSSRMSKLGDGRMKIDREEFVSDGSFEQTWEKIEVADSDLKRINECKNRISADEKLIVSLTPWIDYGVSLRLCNTDRTDLVIGSMPAGTEQSDIDEALGELYTSVDIVSRDAGAVYVSLISLKSDTDEAAKKLSSLGFIRISFPGVDKTPKKAIAFLNEEVAQLNSEIENLTEDLRSLSEYLSDIEVLYDIENTSLTEIINKQKMAATEDCAVLVGWAPQMRVEKLSAELDKLCCAYEIEDPSETETPPVLLNNNRFSENFEWVVGMYSYPKYGSFDPTFIMSIFYFFIFGLMFADVGYGLVLTVCGFALPALMGMSEKTKRSFNMFGYCGISSMIMGVIFGGWFGDLPYAIMQNMAGIENAKEIYPFFDGLWFNPMDNPMTFLVVALAVGGIHLIAGMAIKFYILCKEGKVFDAIFDIGSWWVIFAGIGVLFVFGALPGWITVGVGVAMIVFTHGRNEKNIVVKLLKGILGLYDITSYASDLLSYSRILALGLASAVVGQVINLIGTMSGATVGGFVALIFAMVLGHTLNLAINILGSFVHTSRLQYLEFFNKFYEDGGEPFEAVEPSEKYTID